jgi:protein-S-isoprenylcysteine O-methyltransferase Ste14
MNGVRIAAGIVWVVFWIGWFAAAVTAKETASRGSGWRARIGIWVVLVVCFRLLHPKGLEVHSVGLAVVGLVVQLLGLALAVWARVYLGRNWGMPTTMRAEPELVTAGPYRYVRHPIYTGIILAVAAASLIFNVIALVVAFCVLVLFYNSARVEERNMTDVFPSQYPEYKARTKMLIPFLL